MTDRKYNVSIQDSKTGKTVITFQLTANEIAVFLNTTKVNGNLVISIPDTVVKRVADTVTNAISK